MCGIVGYVGDRDASSTLVNALKKLEYRGYDSVGISCLKEGNIETRKTKGRIRDLETFIEGNPFEEDYSCGIGHTRWATHGEPNDVNSHPHGNARISLVHNGIIENHSIIRKQMVEAGYTFYSETDTEVIVKLLDYRISQGDDINHALRYLIHNLEGSYALGVIFSDAPRKIYALRKESPLIVGVGSGENFISSDITAILKYTKSYYDIEEGEIAVISDNEIEILDIDEFAPIERELVTVDWEEDVAEKQGYQHFMLKEIMEQPSVFRRAIKGRISNSKVTFENEGIEDDFFTNIKRVHIVGCGSAYNSGLIMKRTIEKWCRIPVIADIASEFRYNDPILNDDDLVIIISQSGETADSLSALKLAKKRGIRTLAIVNVIGSSIAKLADKVILMQAQIEISVASTKAYFAQLVVGYLVAFKLVDIMGKWNEEYQNLFNEFLTVGDKVKKVLDDISVYQYIASEFYTSSNLFYIGRGLDYYMSLEASLKLKEISYIHCEAYPSGELKHGTISLIEEGTPVFVLASQKNVLEKTVSNAFEVKARGAKVLFISTYDDEMFKDGDYTILVETIHDDLSSMLMVLPIQLIAYFVSSLRGCDIDKPRNLAKSVTVE
ncbi:MAG: glutamine--fructose-6-phosphate transaminase (isomerizing) [Clostridiales bacterium]|nr:MAG: glutamine--fructose-6-phosphate transaminase (isomerizing) [Clostridiales bacterium]